MNPSLGQLKAASKGSQNNTEPALTRVKQETQDAGPETELLEGSFTHGPNAVQKHAEEQVQLSVSGWPHRA